jgi:hypothetical protein
MPVTEKITCVFTDDLLFSLYKVLFRKPQGKLLFGRSRNGCEKTTAMNIKETEYGNV